GWGAWVAARRRGPPSAVLDTAQSLQPNAYLEVTTEGVRQLDLSWRSALRCEQLGRCDEHANAFGSRRRDVQAIQAVQELHAARGIGVRGRRHRVDDDRRFLTLKLVDRADAGTREPFL